MPSARRWARSCSMRLLTSMSSMAISPTPHHQLAWHNRPRGAGVLVTSFRVLVWSSAILRRAGTRVNLRATQSLRAQVSLAGLSLLAQTYLPCASPIFTQTGLVELKSGAVWAHQDPQRSVSAALPRRSVATVPVVLSVGALHPGTAIGATRLRSAALDRGVPMAAGPSALDGCDVGVEVRPFTSPGRGPARSPVPSDRACPRRGGAEHPAGKC